MIVVPNPDARAALFIVYSNDASRTVESVAVTGCLSDHGIVAHGPPSDPSLRVNWVAGGVRGYLTTSDALCACKRHRAQGIWSCCVSGNNYYPLRRARPRSSSGSDCLNTFTPPVSIRCSSTESSNHSQELFWTGNRLFSCPFSILAQCSRSLTGLLLL